MKAVKLSAAILALGLVATPAAAQLGFQPVYAIPSGTGVSINADFGMVVDPSVPGGSNNLAARVTLGLPMISFVAGFQPEMLDLDGAGSSIMAGAAFSLMPVPVNLRIQATAGYNLDSKNLMVPVGVVIGLNVPSPALSVKPWIFPSARIGIPDVGDTFVDFGASAGVSVGLPGGIGGHLALDFNASDPSITTFGVGLHYMLSVPGLGMM